MTMSTATWPPWRRKFLLPNPVKGNRALKVRKRRLAPMFIIFCLAGCAGGTKTNAGDIGHYCELNQNLDRATRQLYAEVWTAEESAEIETEEDFNRLFQAFVQELFERHGSDFEELSKAAPPSLRPDLRTVWEFQDELAKGIERSADVEQAESRIIGFNEKNCV